MSPARYYAVVFVHEDNRTVSAYLPDLAGVYASANTVAAARSGIRRALEAYLETMAARGWTVREPAAEVAVIRVESTGNQAQVRLVGVGALLRKRRSRTKAAAARENGKKGGRPRKAAAA